MSTADSDPQALIAQAIQSARYNEAVVVTVNDGDEDVPREIVLVACLDKRTVASFGKMPLFLLHLPRLMMVPTQLIEEARMMLELFDICVQRNGRYPC